MSTRISLSQKAPKAYQIMLTFEAYLDQTSLTPIQKELIKIRASQINKCAFCLNMHTEHALKIGETQQRIFLLNAWRETRLFTDAEKVLLAMTEEITLIHHHGLTEETYRKALAIYSEDEIAQMIFAIIIINSWNRIAISSKTDVAVS